MLCFLSYEEVLLLCLRWNPAIQTPVFQKISKMSCRVQNSLRNLQNSEKKAKCHPFYWRANQTQDWKEVSDDLQFSLVCSQAYTTIKARIQKLLLISTITINFEDYPRRRIEGGPTTIIVNFSNIYFCCIVSAFTIKMLEIWWSFSWYSHTSTSSIV